jgi:hypothetical protein
MVFTIRGFCYFSAKKLQTAGIIAAVRRKFVEEIYFFRGGIFMKKFLIALIFSALFLFTACNGGENSGGGNPPPRDLPENPASDFNYRAVPGGVEITKYIGTLIRVRIPEKIEGVAVTSIGVRAFERSGIMEVYIPNSVIWIGERAFWRNTSLTSVTIPNSVITIGEWAFAENTGLTSVTIPDSVTHIGFAAFVGCTALTSVTIPDSVTSIGNSAFGAIEGLAVTYKGITYSAEERRINRQQGEFEWESIEWNLPREFYNTVNGR